MFVVNLLLYIALGLACFVAMEAVAWLTHRFIMHGWLWVWHKDHHLPHSGALQKNDLFVVIFATPAIGLLIMGIHFQNWWLISAGIGVSAYGLSYSLFHDIMFHRRLRWLKIPAGSPYLQRIINAHRAHHRSLDRQGGEAFGFLWAPARYAGKTRNKTGKD